MKTKNILIVISAMVVLSVSGFALYRLGLQRGTQHDAQATAMNTQSTPEKKILYWHDPMVPATKFEKPGKSPFMDMQLVPVYADEGSTDTSAVSINPRVQQNFGVRLTEITLGHLGANINAIGSVAYNESDITLMQARSNGFVEKLYVRAALDTVRKGQPLAQLYVPEWIAAQEEFLSVKNMSNTRADMLASLLDGARQRMRLVGMNEQQIALVENSGKVQARFTITAPTSGVITELTAREGMTIMAGAALFKINGLDQVWINAEIAENSASQIRVGSAVEVRSAALGTQVFHGKVSALLPEINPTTRTQKARITLPNSGRQFTPGMFVNVSMTLAKSKEFLLAPSEAIITTGDRNLVMLADGTGKFSPVEVETGITENGQTVILRGVKSDIKAGQKIVTSGQFLIDSEANLKTGISHMSDAGEKK